MDQKVSTSLAQILHVVATPVKWIPQVFQVNSMLIYVIGRDIETTGIVQSAVRRERQACGLSWGYDFTEKTMANLTGGYTRTGMLPPKEIDNMDTTSADVVDSRTGRPSAATIAFSLSYDAPRPELAQQVAGGKYLGTYIKT